MLNLLLVCALATPPVAERLHGEAKAAYKDGRRGDAAALWEEAERAHPHWKYAYNLANVLYEEQRAVEAWAALERAQSRAIPDKYMGHVLELRAKIKSAMLKSHAWLELTVEPKTATVQRDGQAWAPPWTAWSTAASSRLSITAPGFEPRELTWTHEVGRPHTRRVVLKRVEAPVDPPTVSTGSAGGLTTGGWVTAGVGIAALAAGVGVMVWADGELVAYNDMSAAEAAAKFDSHPAYVQEGEDLDSVRITGWVVAGTGAALAVAGAVMVVLDQSDEPPVDVSPMFVPRGGGLNASLRF